MRPCMCPAGPEKMMADATLALAQEPEWSVWRDTALIACAEAHLLYGEVDRAAALFTETSAVAATLGNADTIAISNAELAVLAMDRRRWAEAAERLEAALAVRCSREGRLRLQHACLRRCCPARKTYSWPAPSDS